MSLEEVEHCGRECLRDIGPVSAAWDRPKLCGSAGFAARPASDRRFGGGAIDGDISVDVNALVDLRRLRAAVVPRPYRDRCLGTRICAHRRAGTEIDGAALVQDGVVRSAVYLEDGDGRYGSTIRLLGEGRSREAGDRRDRVGVGAGKRVAHEPTVRMADHVDSLRVDGEGRLDVPDDAGEVSRIVDPFVVE